MSEKLDFEQNKTVGKGSTKSKLIRLVKGLRKENKKLRATNAKAVKKYQKENALKPFQAELIKLQEYLEEHSRRMIVVFEGRDAAGKGGAIRRVTEHMNPRHYRVVALGRPTETQRSQWYYQKYVENFPRGGEIVLFDRSWYNRALVEHVFDFCTPKEHENFMQGVVGFEEDLVRGETILIKFYLSVSKAEQARRFEVRKTNPLKKWKLSEIDLLAQDRWEDFTQVKFEMLRTTHTIRTPWTIIRADSRFKARLNIMKIMLNSVDYPGRNRKLDYGIDPAIVVSGASELERMKAARLKDGKFSG